MQTRWFSFDTPVPQDRQAPAIILDPETGGIGIIHSLGPLGIPLISVERRWPPRLGHLSRFVERTVFLPDGGEGTLAQALLALGPQLPDRGVLFPSTDEQLEQLMEHYDALTRFYAVPTNPRLGPVLFQKSWQYALAEQLGVPTPPHVHFRGGEVPDFKGLRFPLIIKPVARVAREGAPAFRLRVVEHLEALHRCLEEIGQQHAGRLFQLAENIPGDSSTLVTVGSYSNREGKVLVSYTGRKLTQWPFTHGSASIAESTDLPREVIDYARALLEQAAIHGITQVEFKYDARDRTYRLIEINGRTWSWIKLATESGINLPLIQYADLAWPEALPGLLSSAQRNDCFFVFDYHVALNRNADEKQLLQSLSQSKRRVEAMWYPGEWKLWAAHRVLAAAKVLRERFRQWRQPKALEPEAAVGGTVKCS